MDLCNINDIRALLARHGFRFSKSMGQNFLIESWVPREIADAAGLDETCGVLEVGPGIGPLTVQLSARAGKVVAVELDRTLLPVLQETLSGCGNVTVVSGDVLKLNLEQLVEDHFSALRPTVCANLPYNVTTPVLTALLGAKRFRSLTVMIQREVAKRICAVPGTADYGAFSLFCQYHAACSLLFEVPPDCFLPAPKVTSAVLQMIPYDTPPVTVRNEALLFRTIRASFALRRKTLLNGLASGYGSQLSKQQLAEAISACALPADVRGERLSLAQFAALTDALHSRLPK